MDSTFITQSFGNLLSLHSGDLFYGFQGSRDLFAGTCFRSCEARTASGTPAHKTKIILVLFAFIFEAVINASSVILCAFNVRLGNLRKNCPYQCLEKLPQSLFRKTVFLDFVYFQLWYTKGHP